jgi:hypothetical protein
MLLFSLLVLMNFTGCFLDGSGNGDGDPGSGPVNCNVSGTINLPDGDTLISGYFEIEFEGGEYYTMLGSGWPYGSAQSYSIELGAREYDHIGIYVHNDNGDVVYEYSADSAGLTVDSNITDYDFTVEEVL